MRKRNKNVVLFPPMTWRQRRSLFLTLRRTEECVSANDYYWLFILNSFWSWEKNGKEISGHVTCLYCGNQWKSSLNFLQTQLVCLQITSKHTRTIRSLPEGGRSSGPFKGWSERRRKQEEARERCGWPTTDSLARSFAFLLASLCRLSMEIQTTQRVRRADLWTWVIIFWLAQRWHLTSAEDFEWKSWPAGGIYKMLFHLCFFFFSSASLC